MVEANTGDASASGCRSVTTPPAIAFSVAKPQSAPVKSWIDRTSTWPTAAGLRWALGRGRTVAVGRTSVVCLCGLDGWSQPRAGSRCEFSPGSQLLEKRPVAALEPRKKQGVIRTDYDVVSSYNPLEEGDRRAEPPTTTGATPQTEAAWRRAPAGEISGGGGGEGKDAATS